MLFKNLLFEITGFEILKGSSGKILIINAFLFINLIFLKVSLSKNIDLKKIIRSYFFYFFKKSRVFFCKKIIYH